MNIAPILASLLMCAAVAAQARQAQSRANGWDPDYFRYTRPENLVVEQTTPTEDQMSFFKRPAQMDVAAPLPRSTGPAEPMRFANIDVIHLRFEDAQGDIVPAVLCTPADKKGPFPVVIATHGLMSNKAQVCAQVAPELIRRGFAVLAADMPCHGERPGQPWEVLGKGDHAKGARIFRQAIIDDRQLIDVAEKLPQLDTRRGVLLVGYSMGSFISSVAGPADDRVRAMILMVGGAVDVPAAQLTDPALAQIDPRRAIGHFAPRPILMLNGRDDHVVNRAMANLLWESALKPKKQLWYDSGHLLPAQAYADAARWALEQIQR